MSENYSTVTSSCKEHSTLLHISQRPNPRPRMCKNTGHWKPEWELLGHVASSMYIWSSITPHPLLPTPSPPLTPLSLSSPCHHSHIACTMQQPTLSFKWMYYTVKKANHSFRSMCDKSTASLLQSGEQLYANVINNNTVRFYINSHPQKLQQRCQSSFKMSLLFFFFFFFF